jgi:hypothetical protein
MVARNNTAAVRMNDQEFQEFNKLKERLGWSATQIFMEGLLTLAVDRYKHAVKLLNSIEGGSITADDPKELDIFKRQLEQMRDCWEVFAQQGLENNPSGEIELEMGDGEIQEVK